MKYPQKVVKSLSELVKHLDTYKSAGTISWFRGQANLDWKLVPSLARTAKSSAAEAALIKRFKQNALTHLPDRPLTEWEWMFQMQHHKLPTRLLDWSESPLVALFFALGDAKHKNKDGAVWCIDPIALNKHANINFSSDVEIPAFDHDPVLDSYLPSKIPQDDGTRRRIK